MRTRLAALFAALTTLAAVTGLAPARVAAQTVSEQPFGGYGSGATVSVNVLGVLGTQTLNVQAASAGQSTNSQGLPGDGLFNELGYVIQPPDVPGNSYGRGTGLEIGAVTPIPNPDPNQILLAGLAEQQAPPVEPLPDVRTIGPVALGGIAYANLLSGVARALWDPATCVIGRPFSFGEGSAAGLQLVGTPGAGGVLESPLVGTNPLLDPNPNNVSRTRSLTYLRPNGDGTFAVVSETRQFIAPVQLLGGAATLELLGEWALRAIATGKPGGASVEYAPVGAGPTTVVARLLLGATEAISLTTQDLFGAGGFNLESVLGGLAALLNVTIGTPARALGGAPGSAPALAADGTAAAAAVDVATVAVLDIPNVLTGADIRIGHMEVAAVAPPGGVRCNIPVAKVGSPDPVTVGQDFTITIRIPSDAGEFQTLFGCDLAGIRVVDVHEVESGNASFVLTGASHGGVISADGSTVTFENLNYSIGDPPLELTVTGRIPGTSGAGVLRDTATVTATLANCFGAGEDLTGVDIVGQAVTGGEVQGTFTLRGPEVSRAGVLAATGGDARLLVLGGVMLLAAIAVRRRLRKPSPAS